uniref:Uncharacterized protein n=1 Tax=Noctiluca scintillans TaxID=2966 RepID=A0A7S0ZQ90_NOCSC
MAQAISRKARGQTATMGGHQRLWHPKWYSRYVFGTFASLNLWAFVSEQQYGISRHKDPDIAWPWWSEIMRKKEAGLIPMEMPGYMLSKYRNESEERWMENRRHEFAEALAQLEEAE